MTLLNKQGCKLPTRRGPRGWSPGSKRTPVGRVPMSDLPPALQALRGPWGGSGWFRRTCAAFCAMASLADDFRWFKWPLLDKVRLTAIKSRPTRMRFRTYTCPSSPYRNGYHFAGRPPGARKQPGTIDPIHKSRASRRICDVQDQRPQ